MRIVKETRPIDPQMLELACPRVARYLLVEPKMTALRLRTLQRSLLSASGQRARVQEEEKLQTRAMAGQLRERGFSVTRDGTTLQAQAQSVRGTEQVRGINVTIKKETPAVMGVFGKSTTGREMEVTNRTTGARLTDIGGIDKPKDIERVVARNNLKPAESTTPTEAKTKNPIAAAKLRKQLSTQGVATAGLDL
jgi:hypothetical protein